MLRVTYYAHDCSVQGFRYVPEVHHVAESGLRRAEIMLREAAVHDGNIFCAQDVMVGKRASGEQRHLHSGEILGRHPRLLRLHVFVFLGVVADDPDISVVVLTRQVRIIRSGDGTDTGQPGHGIEDSPVQGIDLIGLISSQPRIDVKAKQVVGGESQIDGLQIAQSAHEQACSDEQ